MSNKCPDQNSAHRKKTETGFTMIDSVMIFNDTRVRVYLKYQF